MNQQEYEAQLAEYLGGELDAEAIAAFEADLERHPERKAEVEELRATLADLESLQIAKPKPASRSMAVPERSRSVLYRERQQNALFTAAAILIFGILIGRWSSPTAQTSPPSETNTPVIANAGEIHPGWYRLAERLGQNNTSFSSVLRSTARDLR